MSSPNPTQPEEEYGDPEIPEEGTDIGADAAYAQMEEDALKEEDTI